MVEFRKKIKNIILTEKFGFETQIDHFDEFLELKTNLVKFHKKIIIAINIEENIEEIYRKVLKEINERHGGLEIIERFSTYCNFYSRNIHLYEENNKYYVEFISWEGCEKVVEYITNKKNFIEKKKTIE